MDAVTFTDRKSLWQQFKAGNCRTWDLIVIGGGITGAGVLREAVRRGYVSLLVEQRDFAWGSSSRSSKMVHGGLRYLAAGNFSLTRHSLIERERLLREAPGLVERIGYNYPLYPDVFPPRFAAGVLFWLYDKIAGISNHRYLDNQQLSAKFADLDTSATNGAFYYTDAVTDDARLTLRVLQESIREGGQAMNYTRAERLIRTNGRVCGLTLKDGESGEHVDLESAVVINATGAWADRLRSESASSRNIHPQRGSHIVLCSEHFPVFEAIFLLHPEDGRRVFIYPWEQRTVIGTTDIHHPGDLDIAASMTAAELHYLLQAGKQLFPSKPPTAGDVISSWSGVRPIISSGRGGSPSSQTRKHRIWVDNGLLTCAGGKLTTFRYMAHDVLDKAGPFMRPPSSHKDDRVFPANPLRGADICPDRAALGERLLGRFGPDAKALVAEMHENESALVEGTACSLAELRWSLKHEAVVHLDDLMLRRTRLGLLLRNGGSDVLDLVQRLCHDVLGWDDERWMDEKARYEKTIHAHYAVPTVD